MVFLPFYVRSFRENHGASPDSRTVSRVGCGHRRILRIYRAAAEYTSTLICMPGTILNAHSSPVRHVEEQPRDLRHVLTPEAHLGHISISLTSEHCADLSRCTTLTIYWLLLGMQVWKQSLLP